MNLQDREVELNFREVTCKRAVNGVNFSRGIQDFDFSVSGKNAFIPSLSYFVIDATLTARVTNGPRFIDDIATGAIALATAATSERPVYYSDGLALADNFGSCLYNNAFFRAGNSDVSLITQYIPQAGVLKSRLDKSNAWSQSVGRIVFQDDADFTRRRNYVSFDGKFHEDGLKQVQYRRIAGYETTGAVLVNYGSSQFGYVAATGVGTITLAGSLSLVATQLQVGDVIVATGGRRFQLQSFTGAIQHALTGLYREMGVNTAGGDLGSAVITDILRISDPACGANTTQVMFQPPLGIFSEANPISGGDFKISLNPSPNFKVNGVQSLTQLQPYLDGQNVPFDYDLVIQNVRFYVCTIKSDVSPTGVIPLSLIEMAVLNKTLNTTAGTQNLDFTVPPSTLAITVFVQGSECGNSTTCPATKFYLQPDAGLAAVEPLTGTASVLVNNRANRVSQIQVTYGSITKTQTLYTSAYNMPSAAVDYNGGIGGVNQNIQRFLQTQQYSGKITSEGGTETQPHYLERGSIFHFDFSKDKNDTSSYVNVQIGFETNIGPNQNLFIVAHYSRQAEISYENGFITQVVSVNR